MRTQQRCGISPKIGTVLSAVFTIISTDLYLIFEEKYMKRSNCSAVQVQHEALKQHLMQHVMCWSFQIAIFTSLVTFMVSFLLLFSVYTQKFGGMAVYCIWIIVYEVVNVMIQVATSGNPEKGVIKLMRLFGLVSRILMHTLWLLFFVFNYMQITYKRSREGNMLTSNRRHSAESKDFWRRKSKLMSFSRYHK
ncbi:transmembrane protein 217 [Tenrec ecaudatus]|uniref:transmembrane protein 217 n=1 Tax=Tenrec ecaudatus TaxID=94439 RepID=UPI003F59AE72